MPRSPARALVPLALLAALAPLARPAGDVLVTANNGRLLVRGDGQDNRVVIDETSPGVFRTTGLGGTTINGGGPSFHAGIDRGMRITMGGGVDRVRLERAAILESLTINTGTEPDYIELTDVQVHGSVKLITGRGPDTITMSNVVIDRRLHVATSLGADRMTLTDTTVSGKARVDTQRGDDAVDLVGVTAERRFSVRLYRGDDSLRLAESSFLRLRANGGKGTDALVDGGGNTFTKRPRTRRFEATLDP